MAIVIKSPREIELMRQAGRIVAETLAVLAEAVAPGVRTRELDEIASREVALRGGVCSFKGYRGYPASVCVSINDEVVHGIPGERVLREGDVVSLDLGAIYKGFQGDAALTIAVGKVPPEVERLIEVTREALEAGIAVARAGGYLGDISAAIQEHAEAAGFSVVREYVGHGIGREMHEDPQVPNFGERGREPRLVEGMTLALEPMVNLGDWHTRVAEDQWTVRTMDGLPSAHFEHTIAITNGAAEVLTAV